MPRLRPLLSIAKLRPSITRWTRHLPALFGHSPVVPPVLTRRLPFAYSVLLLPLSDHSIQTSDFLSVRPSVNHHLFSRVAADHHHLTIDLLEGGGRLLRRALTPRPERPSADGWSMPASTGNDGSTSDLASQRLVWGGLRRLISRCSWAANGAMCIGSRAPHPAWPLSSDARRAQRARGS